MVERKENKSRFLKIDFGRDDVYQKCFSILSGEERERVEKFLSSSRSDLSKLFREYEYPHHLRLCLNLILEVLTSERPIFEPETPNLRRDWNAICGVFFEPLTTYYLKDMFDKEYMIVPGGEVGASWRSPDAFLVRDIETAFVVCGAFEYKFGITTYEQEERLARQISDLDNIEAYFESSTHRQRLVQFLGIEKDIVANPRGYVRKFLVTPQNFRDPEIPGVVNIQVPLSKNQISNICAASLVDFSVFQGRVILSS